jgi:hypothetical protein
MVKWSSGMISIIKAIQWKTPDGKIVRRVLVRWKANLEPCWVDWNKAMMYRLILPK